MEDNKLVKIESEDGKSYNMLILNEFDHKNKKYAVLMEMNNCGCDEDCDCEHDCDSNCDCECEHDCEIKMVMKFLNQLMMRKRLMK